MRILIAEDNRIACQALQSALEAWDYDVKVATDGDEAWQVLQEQDAPRLAILDWTMPGMDGLEVTRRVRQRSAEDYVYIIILTSNDRKEDIVASIDAGADDYLTKPFEPQELRARLHAARRIIELKGRIIEEGRSRELAQRRHLEELAEARKLTAIGQLAAGVAHEINTPAQYVGDNTQFLREVFSDMIAVLQKYDELLQAARNGSIPASLLAEVETAAAGVDVKYLCDEVPRAIQQSLEGLNHICKIVAAMRDFSHPHAGRDESPIDLNRAIEDTVIVARNEWKYVAQVELDLDPSLPMITCCRDELNQVFLNLLMNAARTVGDRLGDGPKTKGTIAISTCQRGRWVEVSVRDTGTGIPEEIRDRIFDPFFTTKEVGKGIGQGLAVAHSVVEKHGGTISFTTQMGEGTTFTVRLPLGAETECRDVPGQEMTHVS